MPVAETREKKKSIGEYLKEAVIMPRFWHGMLFSTWMKLLVRNRVAISPRRIPLALGVTGFSMLNSVLRVVQERMYARVADRVPMHEPPLFIIGHWRSGTTLLHELMVLDPRHNFPSYYQCFAPNHFIISEWFVSRFLGFVLPKKRPMDNMATGWDKPQEDEFALCNLGIPSPYLAMAFPNRPAPHTNYLDMEDLDEAELRAWKDALLWFLRRVTLGDSRRIILKSPPHTGRVKVLLDVFPQAKFVHIVRDPYTVFASTVRLWKSLNQMQGLQVPKPRDLNEYVFECFERMYRNFEQHKALVHPSQFYEIRYEDLVADPIPQVRAIYEHLNLGDFDKVSPRLEAYFEQKRDYRVNKHDLPPQLREEISRRLGGYIERYGYGAA